MAGTDRLVVRTAAGVRRAALADYLSADRAEYAEVEANAWIKALRHARVDGVPFRDRFTCRGDSLWWFAELYLHKMQAINEVFRAVLALEELIRRERPIGLGVEDGTTTVRLVARAIAGSHGIAWIGGGGRRAAAWWPTLRVMAKAHALVFNSRLARRSRARAMPATARVLAFVHSAFWRGSEEQYIGPVLHELAEALPPDGLVLIGVGPRTSYRARTWRHRLADAGGRGLETTAFIPLADVAPTASSREGVEFWRNRRVIFDALCRSADIRRAAIVRGCDAWPLVKPLLAGIAYLQFPWSVQTMDQVGSAFDALKPSAAVTYAEAGGWGRAIVLEARRRSIATVGLQHGFIYRHWLNYRHEVDEVEPSAGNPRDVGFPRPTMTLLYDQVGLRQLEQAGRFPSTALAVTGSARLDALVERAGRLSPADLEAVRLAVGAGAGQHLVLVAAKYTQIRRVFPALVAAAGAIPDVRVVVKCHPAESAAPYLAAAANAAHVTVAPSSADLAALTKAARLVVTVNSTAALEALVMGVPSLVLALPSNLSPFVDAGVMGGVIEGDPVEPTLRALLLDRDRREEMLARGRAFLAANQIGSDGQAAARAARHILRVASANAGDTVC